MNNKSRPPKWLPHLESCSAKIATWFVDSNYRMISLILIVLIFGVVLGNCFDMAYSFKRSGWFLVAIAIFFAFGEMINSRMVNSTLHAVKKHYAGIGGAVNHISNLEIEGDQLKEANIKISGWQFFMAISGTLVWGFG